MPPMPRDSAALSTDQRTKLNRELEVVSGNVRVMSEMLTELSPSAVEASDLELLQVGGSRWMGCCRLQNEQPCINVFNSSIESACTDVFRY